jgi:hypothetical protein
VTVPNVTVLNAMVLNVMVPNVTVLNAMVRSVTVRNVTVRSVTVRSVTVRNVRVLSVTVLSVVLIWVQNVAQNVAPIWARNEVQNVVEARSAQDGRVVPVLHSAVHFVVPAGHNAAPVVRFAVLVLVEMALRFSLADPFDVFRTESGHLALLSDPVNLPESDLLVGPKVGALLRMAVSPKHQEVFVRAVVRLLRCCQDLQAPPVRASPDWDARNAHPD